MENDLETSQWVDGWRRERGGVGGRVVVVDIRNYWRYPHLGGCLGWDAGG